MGIRIFTTNFLQNQLPTEELEDLVRNFRTYKNTGDPGEHFGPDYPYQKPPSVVSADLWHVHIPDAGKKKFNLRMTQFRRGSDTALVYCHGFFKEDHILLLGILSNAHDAYYHKRNSWYVPFIEMAEKFRSKY